jgi:peptidoglycan/LPS O-acetylase OafA/YrhL
MENVPLLHTTRTEMKQPKILSLQAGRALAAIAVLFHHAVASTADFTKGMPPIVAWLGSFGYLGVDFFFVLSGFIIYHVHQRDGRANLTRYISSRAKRVFVPYWPVGVGMALVYTLLPNLSAGERHWSWLASLTLLPSVGDPALIVAWTLIYEFLFGILAALIVAKSRSVTIPLFGAALSFAAYCFAGAYPDVRTLFGLSMAFIVVAAVRAEAAFLIKVPSALAFLGGASYSLYLVHNPVCALAARLFERWWIALTAACIAAAAAGIVYHLFVERPVLSLFARMIRK